MKKFSKYRAGVTTFFSALLIVGILNAVTPKPTYSETEHRELAKFPTFSFETLADGSFLSKFQTYFSDTFLGRDWLFELSSKIKGLYGIQDDDIVIMPDPNQNQDTGIAQQPDSDSSSQPQTPSSDPSQNTSSGGTSSQPTTSQPDSSQTSSTPVSSEPPTSSTNVREEEGTSVNGFVLGGSTVFQLYGYSEGINNRYAAALNKFAEKYPEINTHCMVVPINTAFYLPEKYLPNTSDEKQSIEKIYAALSDKINTVDAYSKIEQHVDEYIYFRTDHHWTQLGAYYGYSAFIEDLGGTPVDISDWETVTYENFLGSLYSSVRNNAKAAEILKKNPDTLTAYIPDFQYKLDYYPPDSITKPWYVRGSNKLVQDKMNPKYSNKYECFIEGDQPMEVILNLDNQNGKTLMIFKESYANAFVPFVCHDYEKVIVIDPRYFKGSLSELMTLHEVDDALFLNYILAPGTSYRVNEIEKVVNS